MSILILIKGTLEVTAKRYWYTSGGEKGSFGFYPHLKRIEGGKVFPIFPDTQIHGDLRMAAEWLSRRSSSESGSAQVEGQKDALDSGSRIGVRDRPHRKDEEDPPNEPEQSQQFSEDLVKRVFGKEGSQAPSLFSITDLELTEGKKPEWSSTRFVVKPRSEIEDTSRTNKDKMLAFREVSYLEGLTLNASFCMGYCKETSEYCKETSEADSALALLRASLDLLSGFGANRSRGYSRGIFEIKDVETVRIAAPGHSQPAKSRRFRYTVKPLVNFRNKPINPANIQLIRSEKVISERQMKAWFANTFHDLYDDWPSPQQISTIRFSSFYPALGNIPAFPPSFSTVQFEDDSMKDNYDQKSKDDDPNEQENTVRSKAKPPKEGIFLTNEETPSAFKVKAEKRFRNSMDDKFVTLETGGLFAQEFIRAGQSFCGTVSLEGKDADFESKAFFLLEKAYPKINGAFFEPSLEDLEEQETTTGKTDLPFVLTEPLEFSQERMKKGIQVRLDSMRGYNTTLRRPRRNRIVFSPGSLMSEDVDGRAIVWKGLKHTVETTLLKKPDRLTVAPSKLPKPDPVMEKMTRTQAGNLRRFLEMDPALAQNRIEALLSKYSRWKKPDDTISEHLIPKKYLERAKALLDEGKVEAFKQYIQQLLQQYAVTQWKEKSKSSTGTANKGGGHGITE